MKRFALALLLLATLAACTPAYAPRPSTCTAANFCKVYRTVERTPDTVPTPGAP